MTAARPLRSAGLVVARLLEAEGEHPLDEPEVGARRIDAADRAGDTITEVRGVAAEEVELVSDKQREEVVGPFDEQVVERASGAVPVTTEPALDRSAVGLLSRGERQAGELGGRRAGSREGRARRSSVSDRYEASTWPMANSGCSVTRSVVNGTTSGWYRRSRSTARS